MVDSTGRWRSFSRRTPLLAEVKSAGIETFDGAIVVQQLYAV